MAGSNIVFPTQVEDPCQDTGFCVHLGEGKGEAPEVAALAGCRGTTAAQAEALWKAVETACVPILTQAFMEAMCC